MVVRLFPDDMDACCTNTMTGDCSGEQRQKIVSLARSWIGTPYQHQASNKQIGCDCLGLLRGIWKELYNIEPEKPGPYTPDWDLVSKEDVLLNAAKRNLIEAKALCVGCAIVFRWRPNLPAKHLAICSGTDKIIHAYERRGVIETTLNRHWACRIAGVFLFPAQPKY